MAAGTTDMSGAPAPVERESLSGLARLPQTGTNVTRPRARSADTGRLESGGLAHRLRSGIPRRRASRALGAAPQGRLRSRTSRPRPGAGRTPRQRESGQRCVVVRAHVSRTACPLVGAYYMKAAASRKNATSIPSNAITTSARPAATWRTQETTVQETTMLASLSDPRRLPWRRAGGGVGAHPTTTVAPDDFLPTRARTVRQCLSGGGADDAATRHEASSLFAHHVTIPE